MDAGVNKKGIIYLPWLNTIKSSIRRYLDNYFDVPKGTGPVIPLIIIESFAMCISYLISIYLVKSLHFSTFQTGKLISVQSLGTCMGAILAGYFTTKMPSIKVSSVGFILYALGLFLLSILQTYEYLFVVLFLCGLAGVFMMIANLTALIKLSKNDHTRNRIIVLQSVIFNLAFSICSFFMGFLKNNSLRAMFLLFSGLLLISGLILFMMKDHSSYYKPNIISAKSRIKLHIPSISLILPAIFLYGIIYSLVKIHFPVEAVSRFNSEFFVWLLLSLNPLMIILIQPWLIGKLRDIDNGWIIISGSALLGVGYFFFGISNRIVPCLMFIILATTGEMLFSPISKKLAAISFGEGKEGLGLASWKITYYFSGVFGAYFIGFIDDNYSNFNIWGICIPLSLIIILITLFYLAYMNYYKKLV